MKHDWHTKEDREIPFRWSRKCSLCGAKQERESVQKWGRVVGYRWYPLAGRCLPSRRINVTEPAMPRKPAKKAAPVVPKHQKGRTAMKHTFSLYGPTMTQLEAIRNAHGLRSLSAAIGFAANLAARKINQE